MRGDRFEITSLEGDEAVAVETRLEIERLGDALGELEAVEPELAGLVDLGYFCGFTFEEIGAFDFLAIGAPGDDSVAQDAGAVCLVPCGPGGLQPDLERRTAETEDSSYGSLLLP